MDKATLDQRARDAFRRAAPPVNSETFCRVVNDRTRAAKRMRRRPVSRRHVLAACATVLVVAAVSAGAYWALEHHANGQVLIIGDTPSSAAQPTSDAKPSSTSGTVSADRSSTPMTLPSPQGVFAWPHSYPGPKYVNSPAARHLADLIVAFLPDVHLPVREAAEIEDSGTLSLSFGSGDLDPWLHCTVFRSPDRTLDPITAERPRTTLDVPGVAEALMIDGPNEGQWQLLAWLPDNTTINLDSGSLASSGVHTPLVSKNQGERLAGYVAGLLLSGELTLPEATTTTTVPTIFLAHDVANACGESSMNLLAYVTQGRKTDFAKLLVPHAQDQVDAIWASERQRFKASGMSAAHYDAYAGIAVQWENGAYVTLDGYFVQTDPPVPADVGVWLSEDPAGRAAYGVQLWDKSLRWFRLEGQPDGRWLIVP